MTIPFVRQGAQACPQAGDGKHGYSPLPVGKRIAVVEMRQDDRSTSGDCARDVAAPVRDKPRAGEEHVPGRDRARVEVKVRRAGREVSQSRNKLRGSHGAIKRHCAAHRRPPGPLAMTADSKGASGLTPRMRSVPPMMLANTGAATLPP